MPNVKTNFIYNLLLTLSSYLVNLVLFPYVSRVLGVEIIGRTGFMDNVIGYFSLFALLGAGTVGVREIAACGDDQERRSKVFSEIITVIGILTTMVLVIFEISIHFVPRFVENKDLLIVGSFSLLFSSFIIEWLYQGIEHFKYITLRTIAVRISYAILVFIFVKSQDDYMLYYRMTVGAVVINSLINLYHSRKFVTFSFKNISPSRYIKPVFSLGLYKIMISMYSTFNVVFLGFVCSETEVGCYYTSTKIFYIILGILMAFASVMLPRMSSLLAENRMDEFNSRIASSFDLVFAFAIPLMIGGVFFAPEIIAIISGSGYEGAVLPMQIIMPVLLLSGLAQIWVIQVLMPLKKDKVILVSSVAGAVAGVVFNFCLVKHYAAVGSALVLLFSEIAGDSISLYYVLKNKIISFPVKRFAHFLAASVPYVAICAICKSVSANSVISLSVGIIGCFIYFVILNSLVVKGSFISHFITERFDDMSTIFRRNS